MELFMVFFFIMFFGILAFIIFVVFTMIRKSNAHRKLPRVTTYAKLIEKRTYSSEKFTYYYATFELQSGDRMEIRVPRERAGLIVEGDEGELTFQGDMFVDFNYEKY